MALWDTTKTVLKYTSPGAWLIAEGVERAANAVKAAGDKDAAALSDEVERQNLTMQFAKQQARVEQELAIARRIDNAEEVEIEEFYDVSGKAKIGLNGNIQTEFIEVGASGEAQRVTKRVYKFRGWRESGVEQSPG
jgi:hypothetical protein